MSMNADIKAQWTAALRSGEYVQGHGYLNADGKLCCLGVLCELAVKAEVIESTISEHDSIITYGDKEMDVLPPAVREWAGLPDSNRYGNPNNPTVIKDDDEISLAELNDGEGHAERKHTFEEIADLIDAHL
jgi:hypothetical protein